MPNRNAFRLLCLAFALLLPAASPRAAGCDDDFSQPSVGDGKTWKFLALDKSGTATATVAGGQLELAGRGKDIYGKRNEFVTAYRKDIGGDFDVSVKIVSQESTYEWAQAGIVVANDLNDLTQGGYAALDVSPAHGFTVFTDKAQPVGELDGNLGAGKTAYPAWLRLAKKGAQLTAWYKTKDSSAAWTELPKPPVSLMTAANSQIGLFTVSHDSTKTGKSVFDDFKCLNGTAVAIRPLRGNAARPGPGSETREGIDARGRRAGTRSSASPFFDLFDGSRD